MRRILIPIAILIAAVSSAVAQQSPLLDPHAPLEARLAALNAVANDELGLWGRPELAESLRNIMIDKEQPADLRLAIFGQLTTVFFPLTHTSTPKGPNSGHDHHMEAERFNAQVRTLLDDKDVRLQKAAFAWLSMFADPEAIRRAVAVLKGEGGAPLSTVEAIAVVTFVSPAQYFDVVHAAYRKTRDVDAREAALRVLGGYAPAREDLVAAAQSAREPSRVRLAALDTLYASDREGFAKIAAPVLGERPEESGDVIARAITLMRLTRSQPPYRERKLNGYDDDFDRGVRALLGREGALAKLADQYLLATDPNYRSKGNR